MGGYNLSNTGTPSVVIGSNLVNNGFVSGGPTGFSLYRARQLACPVTTTVPNVQPTDFSYGTVTTYDTFTTGNFIFGITGCSTSNVGERAQFLSVNAPYSCPNPPTTDSEEKLDNPQKAIITLNLLEGDKLHDGTQATSDKIIINFIAPTPTSTIINNVITVPGEGKWTYDQSNGTIVFEPEANFTSNPTLLQYTITELVSLKTSNISTAKITYLAPLPLTIVYFKVQNFDSKIQLTWKTADEVNSAYIELQNSQNAIEFVSVEKFDITKNGLYNYFDSAPQKGIQYYRLKMTDLDGSNTYSKTISILYDINENYLSVQNPIVNNTIELKTNIINAQISIMNSWGQSQNYSISKFGESQIINLKNSI